MYNFRGLQIPPNWSWLGDSTKRTKFTWQSNKMRCCYWEESWKPRSLYDSAVCLFFAPFLTVTEFLILEVAISRPVGVWGKLTCFLLISSFYHFKKGLTTPGVECSSFSAAVPQTVLGGRKQKNQKTSSMTNIKEKPMCLQLIINPDFRENI